MITAAIVLAGIMIIILYRLLIITDTNKWIRDIKDGVNGYDYGKLSTDLVKSGMSEKISPPMYRIIQCLLGMIAFSLTLFYGGSLIIAILITLVALLLPGICLRYAIKEENAKMLGDIEHLFSLLYLQKQSGEFFLDSIITSYKVVSHWRLKKALIDMAGAINGNQSITEATEAFADKFDNEHLSALAEIIQHGVEEGESAEMLLDVSEQLAEIHKNQFIEEKARQDLLEIIILAAFLFGFIGAALCLTLPSLGGAVRGLWTS